MIDDEGHVLIVLNGNNPRSGLPEWLNIGIPTFQLSAIDSSHLTLGETGLAGAGALIRNNTSMRVSKMFSNLSN